MFKNIIFAFISLLVLGASQAALANEPATTEAAAVQAMPSTTEKTEASATSASTEKPNDAAKETIRQPANNTQPGNDNHVDFRYCLELKTDREIAECRYKK